MHVFFFLDSVSPDGSTGGKKERVSHNDPTVGGPALERTLSDCCVQVVRTLLFECCVASGEAFHVYFQDTIKLKEATREINITSMLVL